MIEITQLKRMSNRELIDYVMLLQDAFNDELELVVSLKDLIECREAMKAAEDAATCSFERYEKFSRDIVASQAITTNNNVDTIRKVTLNELDDIQSEIDALKNRIPNPSPVRLNILDEAMEVVQKHIDKLASTDM